MPLVQRQWDTISPFRSQIAHRATLFLREHTASSTVRRLDTQERNYLTYKSRKPVRLS